MRLRIVIGVNLDLREWKRWKWNCCLCWFERIARETEQDLEKWWFTKHTPGVFDLCKVLNYWFGMLVLKAWLEIYIFGIIREGVVFVSVKTHLVTTSSKEKRSSSHHPSLYITFFTSCGTSNELELHHHHLLHSKN